MRRAALSLLLLMAGGCSHHAPVADVRPETLPQSPGEAYIVWGRVLNSYVTETGKIDFELLKHDGARDLNTFVAWVATHGPSSQPADYPTPQAKIAYWVNSYNALAMYDVLTNTARPATFLGRAKFFALTKFDVDGKPIDLHSYEDEVIRPAGEERVHFELNCMVRGCPRLPQVPLSPNPSTQEEELRNAAKLFFSEPRNVELHPEKKVVRMSSIPAKFYPKDFKAKAPSLIAYANKWRAPDQQIPADYKVKAIPYDWTLNQK